MRNRLQDLNDHLFTQMERLTDEDLAPEALQRELDRSKAISCIARDIIGNARLALDAHIARTEGPINQPLPKLLED